MKRTELKRKKPLTAKTPPQGQSPLRRTPLRQRSAKRATQMAGYLPLRNAYLAAHPWCQYPEGCNQRATDLHHKRGRSGLRLLDTEWFAASCRFHNDEAETNTGHCLAVGWLVRIEGDD